MQNPYKQIKQGVNAPLILSVAMHDFLDAAAVESELVPEELCIARIPNTQPIGYIHHVALVYKNLEGEVFSLTMAQHHATLKDGTVEKINNLDKEEKTKKRALWSRFWKKA